MSWVVWCFVCWVEWVRYKTKIPDVTYRLYEKVDKVLIGTHINDHTAQYEVLHILQKKVVS